MIYICIVIIYNFYLVFRLSTESDVKTVPMYSTLKKGVSTVVILQDKTNNSNKNMD